MSDLRLAGAWLAQHGWMTPGPTPALATRLAVRRNASVADSVLLAGFIIAAGARAGEQAVAPIRGPDRVAWWWRWRRWWVGWCWRRWLLDRWVRGSTAGPVPAWRGGRRTPCRPDGGRCWACRTWRSRPRPSRAHSRWRRARWPRRSGSTGRGGRAADRPVGGGGCVAVRIRHLLTRPVVADDEESLTADLVMRIEDAREATAPTACCGRCPWCCCSAPHPCWWNARRWRW